MQKGIPSVIETCEHEIPKLGKNTRFYLPVSSVITKVESVFTAEPEMEKSAALTNLEVELNQSDQMDVVKIFSIAEKSYYTGIYIDELEVEKGWIDCDFDFAPRAFNLTDEIVLYKEHGRWVYVCYFNGTVIHAQVLGKSHVEELLVTNLGVLQLHLKMVGIEYLPKQIICLSEGVDFVEGFTIEHKTKASLMNAVADPLDLLPTKITQWRAQRKAAANRSVLLFCLFCLMAAGIAFMVWKQMLLQDEIASYEKTIKENQPMVDSNNQHIQSWDELENVVAEDWPLKLYSKCVKAIPGVKQISFDSIEVRSGYVRLKGRSPKFDPANTLEDNLKKSKELESFVWSGKAPAPSADRSYFTFNFEGEVGSEVEQ